MPRDIIPDLPSKKEFDREYSINFPIFLSGKKDFTDVLDVENASKFAR
jgi:hypothetical protein